MNEEDFLTIIELEKLTKMTNAGLYNYIKKGIFPEPTIKGRQGKGNKDLWNAEEIYEWLAKKNSEDEKFYNFPDLLRITGLNVNYLTEAIKNGDFPKHNKMERKSRWWKKEEVNEFLANQERSLR